MPDQITPQQQPSTLAQPLASAPPPTPSGSGPDKKPTGPFSTKTVRLVLAGTVALLFAYLFFIQQKAKAKSTTSAQDQQALQLVHNASQLNKPPDYSAQVADTVSVDALRAEQSFRGTGATPPPASSYSNIPAFNTQPDRSSTAGTPTPRITAPSPQQQARPSTSNVPQSAKVPSDDPPGRDPQAAVESAINADMEKREAQSVFAPLLIVNNRPAPSSLSNATPPHTIATRQITDDPAPPPLTRPALPLPTEPAPAPASRPNPTPRTSNSAPDDDIPASHPNKSQNAFNNATGPGHKIFEGTEIEAVLTNRLNGTYTGPVNSMVTIDVWSHNRQHLLIPAGTRILGEAHKVSATGQQRLAVTFHRLIMPDGFSASLDKFVGMNQIGETGLKDKVDNHYRQIFGVSIALGAIAGFSARGTNYGTNQSAMDAWRQGFTSNLSQQATQILDRYLNILPTIIIREGTRVKVYLTEDLLLPSYDGHRMSSDL